VLAHGCVLSIAEQRKPILRFSLRLAARCQIEGEFTMSKKPEVNKKPLELTIKIKVGRKDPDALVRLLIKQQQELLSVADSVEYMPHFPMEWLRKTGF
jgi:hypothetical protein